MTMSADKDGAIAELDQLLGESVENLNYAHTFL